jgi:hypothetical protein
MHEGAGTWPSVISRVDKDIQGTALPQGWHDLGEWEIRPVLPSASHVLIFWQHECANRIVYAPAIVVKLP